MCPAGSAAVPTDWRAEKVGFSCQTTRNNPLEIPLHTNAHNTSRRSKGEVNGGKALYNAMFTLQRLGVKYNQSFKSE